MNRPGKQVLETALASVSYSSEYGRENILAAEVLALREDLAQLQAKIERAQALVELWHIRAQPTGILQLKYTALDYADELEAALK